VGVWGVGSGPKPPNPHSPIPNPQSPNIKLNNKKTILFIMILFFLY